MAYSSIFDTAENRKRKWDSSIYEISERVSSFFWDNAPHQYGLEAREGQQDMAFEILDAIRVLEAQMERASCREEMVRAVLGLLKKKRIVLL